MRATGIIRRIDDLGRIVIPKEIRRTLRIKENDPLEIFIDNHGDSPMVCFVKYSPGYTDSLKSLKEDILMAMADSGAMYQAEAFADAMKKCEELCQKFEKND